MRIHEVQMSAFGPFADRQVVSLDALEGAGLFLISGPTGSGKTSLLDAISFALFGQVPGARDARQLKSQHASPDAVPEVVLDVTLRGRRLRVRRSPAFTRPGRKARVPASITLDEQVDGAWSHVTGRLDEAGRVLEDVLGMTLEQFHRVVVLPQGDFAAFLHAKDDDRGALLERLFDVQTYADVQDWFARECREAESSVRDATRTLDHERQALGRVLGGVPEEPEGDERLDDEAGGDAAERPTWAELPPRELVEALATVVREREQAEVEALTATDLAESSLSHAQQALDAGARLASVQERAAAAQAVVVRLTARAESHEQQRRALDAAERAARVEAHHQVLERQARRAENARREAEQARAGLPAHLVVPDDSPNDGARVDRLVTGWLHDLAEQDEVVDEIGHLGRGIRETSRALPQLAERCRAAATALTELEAERRHRSQLVTDAEQALATAAEARASVDVLVREEEALTPVRRARLLLDRLDTEEIPAAQAALRAAREAARQAVEHHRALLRSRLDDMAGELAEQLAEGEPCIVCGSLEHPVPAQRQASVSDDDLATAELAWRAAEETVTAQREALSGLSTRREQAALTLGDDDRPTAEMEAAAAALTQRREQAEATGATATAAQASLDAARAALLELDDRERALTEQVTSTEALRASAEEQIGAAEETARALLVEHSTRCVCAADEGRSDAGPGAPAEEVPARAVLVREGHRRAVDAVTVLRDARATLVDAQDALRVAKGDRDQALADEGFADADRMLAARLGREDRRQLATAVESYERELATAQSTLAEDDVASAVGAERPDLDALTTARDDARRDLQAATSTRTQARLVARDLRALQRRVAALVAELGPLEERRDLVRELADLTAGRGEHNADGISLKTYVLATRLERTVALANERLGDLADSRYELAVDHGRVDRRSRGGLGLQVLDTWTGEHRPVKTLSGGETFMVALALALGTADAVREEAGGVDLQTLFIDEGFGSLDDAALEQVMAVLDDLRAGGRSVGVISHVADMAQRIPTQVRVAKSATGSSVRVVTDVDADPSAA